MCAKVRPIWLARRGAVPYNRAALPGEDCLRVDSDDVVIFAARLPR